jgi:predicted Fe-S protein YdhL (DUF1289 family)
MDASELKIELWKKIESLNADKLQSVYVLIMNYLDGAHDSGEWISMHESEKQAILDGIRQIEKGISAEHQMVLNESRKKYAKNKSGRME